MYKISEVSSLLGVEKTEIFAKLISHKHLLESHITKVDGVTYFNDKGFEILKTLFNMKSSNFESDSNGIEVEAQGVGLSYKEVIKSKPLSRFEKECSIIKDKISIMIDEIEQLDHTIEVLDEMLISYQNKLVAEMEVFSKTQSQVIKKFERLLE